MRQPMCDRREHSGDDFDSLASNGFDAMDYFDYFASQRIWGLFPAHLGMTAVVFALGWRWKRAIGRGSETRRVHGEFVFWWAVGRSVAAWFLGPWAEASQRGLFGLANFGLLAGWLVGTTHGAVVLLWRRHRRRVEPDRRPVE